MFELIFKKYFKPATLHIFVFSFLVFIILNVIENVIHYNIGKYHDADTPSPVKGNGSGSVSAIVITDVNVLVSVSVSLTLVNV